jgi:hypothetical protein
MPVPSLSKALLSESAERVLLLRARLHAQVNKPKKSTIGRSKMTKLLGAVSAALLAAWAFESAATATRPRAYSEFASCPAADDAGVRHTEHLVVTWWPISSHSRTLLSERSARVERVNQPIKAHSAEITVWALLSEWEGIARRPQLETPVHSAAPVMPSSAVQGGDPAEELDLSPLTHEAAGARSHLSGRKELVADVAPTAIHDCA